MKIKNRIRAAYSAFIGKPIGRLTCGVAVEVKRCSECERGNCDQCGYKFHSEGVSKLPDCNDCGRSGSCEHEPKIGKWTRINCPLHVPKETTSDC